MRCSAVAVLAALLGASVSAQPPDPDPIPLPLPAPTPKAVLSPAMTSGVIPPPPYTVRPASVRNFSRMAGS